MAVDAPHVERQPRVADAALISPMRREIIANRIASWFDRGERGGVRAIDIASQLKIPLEVLHDDRTLALLKVRGIRKLKVPGLRYVFLYRALDGMPDGLELRERWHAIERNTSAADKTPGHGNFNGNYQLHNTSQELARKIHAFLVANPGNEYSFSPLNAAIGGFSSTTLKRASMEKFLRSLGVEIRVTGTPGQNGSRRFYSVPK